MKEEVLSLTSTFLLRRQSRSEPGGGRCRAPRLGQEEDFSWASYLERDLAAVRSTQKNRAFSQRTKITWSWIRGAWGKKGEFDSSRNDSFRVHAFRLDYEHDRASDTS